MTRYEALQRRLAQEPHNWLVTGAAGFIGSHLVEALLRLDQNVVGLDNFATGHELNLRQIEAAVGASRWRRFSFIEGDIRSLDTCHAACRAIEYVLHEAALGSVPRSIEDPLSSHESNVTGFLNMLIAARDARVTRFVYAGSSAVYGDHPRLLKVETELGRALSPYACTKLMNEQYAEVFARCYAIDTIGLRYFNVFGPRQDPNGPYAAVIPLWIAAMVRGDPVYINGDGETARDFCYVQNVVQANLLAATVDDPAALNQSYNVAVNGKTTLNELFEILRSLLEPRYEHLREVRPTYRAFRAGDVRLSQADIGKASRLLGYAPQWPVHAGLAEAIGWYTETLEKVEPVQPAEQTPRIQHAAFS